MSTTNSVLPKAVNEWTKDEIEETVVCLDLSMDEIVRWVGSAEDGHMDILGWIIHEKPDEVDEVILARARKDFIFIKAWDGDQGYRPCQM